MGPDHLRVAEVDVVVDEGAGLKRERPGVEDLDGWGHFMLGCGLRSAGASCRLGGGRRSGQGGACLTRELMLAGDI